ALAYPGNIEVPASAGTITGGDAIIDASGTGGAGGAGNGDNIVAGAGGRGQGDIASLLVYADGASLSFGAVSVIAEGYGGAGGAGGTGQDGGIGGLGVGGSADAALQDPYGTGLANATMTVASLDLRTGGL